MSKSPDDRYQTATEIRQALEAATTRGISGIKRRNIALAIGVCLLVILAAVVGSYWKGFKTGEVESIVLTATPVSRNGKDESQDRWPPTRPMGTGSSCNGGPIAG